MGIYTQLKQWRRLRNLTQVELAEISGVARTTIAVIETKGYDGISFFTLDRLCLALDVTPGDLIRYSPRFVTPPNGHQKAGKSGQHKHHKGSKRG